MLVRADRAWGRMARVDQGASTGASRSRAGNLQHRVSALRSGLRHRRLAEVPRCFGGGLQDVAGTPRRPSRTWLGVRPPPTTPANRAQQPPRRRRTPTPRWIGSPTRCSGIASWGAGWSSASLMRRGGQCRGLGHTEGRGSQRRSTSARKRPGLTLSTLATSRNSITSSRRSPRSTFEMKDCGRPGRSASPPATVDTTSSRSHHGQVRWPLVD